MDFSWILGHSKTSYTHADTVKVSLKDGTQESLAELCKTSIPPCRLNPLLFNGHLQTMWTAVKAEGVPIIYKRKIFEAEKSAYDGSFAVDFVVHTPSDPDSTLPPRTTYFSKDELNGLGSDDSKPMLVCLHGLSGGSYENYLRNVLGPLVEKKEWEACVVNARGCANSKITTGVLFNARATWDVRQVIIWLREKFPNRPLFGVGFSLGGNILTNYVGEEGDACVLKAAVVCSNPWNLDVSNITLQSSWIGGQIYSKTMGSNMKRLFEKHADDILQNTNIDPKEVRKAKYLFEFDRAVQCPTWGYPTEGAYYRDASSVDSVLAVRIPFLAIHAEDDPIACNAAIPYEEMKKNPYTVLCTTSWGGHLSWFQPGGHQWHAQAVPAFLKKIMADVDLKSLGGNADVSAKLLQDSPFTPMRRRLDIPPS